MPNPNGPPPPPQPDPAMNVPPAWPGPPTPGEGVPAPPTPEVVDEAQVSFFQVAKAGVQSFALQSRANRAERVENRRARAVNEALQANLDLSNRPITPTARDIERYNQDVEGAMQNIHLGQDNQSRATVGPYASELGGRVAHGRSRRAQRAAERATRGITNLDERILAFGQAGRVEAMRPAHPNGLRWPDGQAIHIVPGSTSNNRPLPRAAYATTSREEFEAVVKAARNGNDIRGDFHIPALQAAQDQTAAATERRRNILTPDQVAVARRIADGRALVDRRIGRSQQLERRENITDRLAGRADDAQRNRRELGHIRRRQVAVRRAAQIAATAARNAPPPDPDDAA